MQYFTLCFFFAFSCLDRCTLPGSIADHVLDAALKILGASIGGFVGGRLKEKSSM
jgi:hypothetical protein